MFETQAPDWSRVDAVIQQHAEEWQRASRLLVDRAHDAVGQRLGLTASFIRRSRGQRLRWERQRKGASQ